LAQHDQQPADLGRAESPAARGRFAAAGQGGNVIDVQFQKFGAQIAGQLGQPFAVRIVFRDTNTQLAAHSPRLVTRPVLQTECTCRRAPAIQMAGLIGKSARFRIPAESNYSGDGEPIKNCINANTIASALVKNAFGASAG
jgi:hypothetical protein